MPNSWMHLRTQNPSYILPPELSASDPLGARDCGWVEQMRPLIREFTQPGGRVLDPFSGFGSTLVASGLEGRHAVGIEIEESRYRISRDRLKAIGMNQSTLLHGDSEVLAITLEPVDLVLTNLPYFGCGFESRSDGQLYQAGYYNTYLEKVRTTLIALKAALKPGGFLVIAVENIHLGGQFVPQAWDVAKLIMARFDFVEERIIVYDKPQGDAPFPLSNRAHEYVLIARHESQACDLDASLTITRALQKAFPETLVIGSFVRWLENPDVTPSDVDLLLPYDSDQTSRVVRWLESENFEITRWGAPVSAEAAGIASAEANYFRAQRLDSNGSRITIDLNFPASTELYASLASRTRWLNDLRCVAGYADLS